MCLMFDKGKGIVLCSRNVSKRSSGTPNGVSVYFALRYPYAPYYGEAGDMYTEAGTFLLPSSFAAARRASASSAR